MLQTVEAEVDVNGTVRLLTPIVMRGIKKRWIFTSTPRWLRSARPVLPPYQQQCGDEPLIFSLATQNQIAFNELFMAEISTKLGLDLNSWRNHPAYEELRTYGALAA